jgi:hypothetical protein
MTETAELDGTLERDHEGRIEAPEGYVPYDGQVIIKTRYATVQRFKNGGWDYKRRTTLPYLLASHYATGESDVLEARNDHLEPNEVEVYYVEDSRRETYEVADDAE